MQLGFNEEPRLKTLSARVPKNLQGERLDVCATQMFSELSRKKIKGIIDNGGAFLNKKRMSIAKFVVNSGDLIELNWDDKAPSSALNLVLPESAILLDTPDFFVVSKPAGVASQATLDSSFDTVAHLIAKSFPSRFSIEKCLMVHRLDKETSGAMIFAKTSQAQRFFEELFVQKKMQKIYDLICFGLPKANEGVIDFPILKDQMRKNTYRALINQAPMRGADAARSSRAGGGAEVRTAVTRFKVQRAFPRSSVAHVRAFPETGRTHQIRVHFQAIGCPLIGDKTYASGVVGHVFGQKFLRHLLHASSLEFVGPDGKPYVVECPLPADFLECLALLETREQK